jgi:hypothetical protein
MTTPETRTGKNATSREGRGGMRTSEVSWKVDGRAYEATTTEGRESQRPLILCKDSKKEQRKHPLALKQQTQHGRKRSNIPCDPPAVFLMQGCSDTTKYEDTEAGPSCLICSKSER